MRVRAGVSCVASEASKQMTAGVLPIPERSEGINKMKAKGVIEKPLASLGPSSDAHDRHFLGRSAPSAWPS
jgi:hypothetical protein